MHTSLYDPERTFPEFAALDIRSLPLNRSALLQRNHRLALPLLAPAFSRIHVTADVVICSSSGWAHGVNAAQARKIVYCYSPPKWLYRPGDYLGRTGRLATRTALAILRPHLLRWDQRAAASAERYLAISSFIGRQIRETYGVEAEVVIPPVTFDAAGPRAEVAGLEPGFFLVVSRLLPYKNVSRVVAAFGQLPSERLVVVGEGPLASELRATAGPNVTLLGRCDDVQLRWLYGVCTGLVSASREDLGLTPLEAGLFGKPAAVLRWGGFLDTVIEGETGVFFDDPTVPAIAEAVQLLRDRSWDAARIRSHCERFSEHAFSQRLREIVIAG